MSTRASNARHVRQRKLNTKQALRIIREDEIDELPEDEAQRNIPQFETGVEKAEEVVSTHSPSQLALAIYINPPTGIPSATGDEAGCYNSWTRRKDTAEFHSYT
jgi:hypothetical protein